MATIFLVRRKFARQAFRATYTPAVAHPVRSREAAVGSVSSLYRPVVKMTAPAGPWPRDVKYIFKGERVGGASSSPSAR